jgi:two-component system sensor histidine kinase CreC
LNISVRFFLGYFFVLGLTAWFVLNTVTDEISPGLRQAREETQVDTAYLLAELAAPDLANGRIADGAFSKALQETKQKAPQAEIFGIRKEIFDYRIYVTDAAGKVVFDSDGQNIGKDFSEKNDVLRVLKGEYGARTSKDVPDDPLTSWMYVSAPILWQGNCIGVLSFAKPNVTLIPYVDRMTGRIRSSGFYMLLFSSLVGVLLMVWLVWSINRLIRYARDVSAGLKASPPTDGGKQFSELAQALAAMRERLEGKQYIEKYVQNLAHEMKSPLTAIVSASELLEYDLPEAERQRFTTLVQEQANHLYLIIERMLSLAKVEQLQHIQDHQAIDLAALVRQTVESRHAALQKRRLSVNTLAEETYPLHGDAFLLRQAFSNLLDNAIDFSPENGIINITLEKTAEKLILKIRDHGNGTPGYALSQVFDRFYSLPRPATGRKSTGLGLPFAREVARLHGGDIHFRNHPEGGAEVVMEIGAG